MYKIYLLFMLLNISMLEVYLINGKYPKDANVTLHIKHKIYIIFNISIV